MTAGGEGAPGGAARVRPGAGGAPETRRVAP
jgi:hypothetical protein